MATTVVVTGLVFLILICGLGATAQNYTGKTIAESLDYAKATHDYSVSDDVFDSFYDSWHDMTNANSTVITASDVQKLLAGPDTYYKVACKQTEDMIEYILGSFDSSWVADTSARVVKVYNDNGQLVGSTEIVGVCRGYIGYNEHLTVMPELHETGSLLFRTITAEGTFYHTYMETIKWQYDNYSSALVLDSPSYFYADVQYADKYASNVAFVPSPYDNNGFCIRCVYNGNSGVTKYTFVTPISDLYTNDLESTVPYIGTATDVNGNEVGIRPDGSIVLSDGTVVFPDTNTGQWQDVYNPVLDPTFWKTLSDLLAENAEGKGASAAQEVTNLNLEGIRSLVSSISDYLKNGFWSDLKQSFLDVFSFDTSNLNLQQFTQYSVANRFLSWADALFYGLTGQHLVSQQQTS